MFLFSFVSLRDAIVETFVCLLVCFFVCFCLSVFSVCLCISVRLFISRTKLIIITCSKSVSHMADRAKSWPVIITIAPAFCKAAQWLADRVTCDHVLALSKT